MSDPAKMSETNVANSVSMYLADKLLTAGYLLYWHTVDAVQTATGWYTNYSTQQDTYLADPTFGAAVAAAKGLLTVRGKTPANPSFLTRLTIDGRVSTAEDEIPVPMLSIAVTTAAPVSNYEMGSNVRWRIRGLSIRGFARDEAEQSAIADLLSIWLDEEMTIDIKDHDAGTLADVGTLQLFGTSSHTTTSLGTEAMTYGLQFNARAQYVA